MSKINPLHPPLPQEPSDRIVWENLCGASLGLALSMAIRESKRPVIIITPDTMTANRIQYELQFFHQEDHQPILDFPDWETLPYDYFSPHQDIISGRLSTLYNIPSLKQGALITPIASLMQRLCPRHYLDGHTFLLRQGDTLKIESTRQRLEKAGYRNVHQTKEHGEFAVRGSILDLYPMGSELPYRIDLLYDEIDSIRTFSPDTQRSLDKVDKIELLPAKEFPLTEEAIDQFRQAWRSHFPGNPLNCPIYQDITEGICTPGIEYYLPLFFDNTASLFDYLPKDCLIITVGAVHPKADEFWQEIRLRYDQLAHDIKRPILPPEELFIATDEIFRLIKQYAGVKIELDLSPTQPCFKGGASVTEDIEKFIASYTGRTLFCAETTGRREVLLQLFNGIHLHPKIYATWQEFMTDTAPLGMTVAPLDEGLNLESPSVTVIAEAQLFGKRIMQRRRRKETAQDTDSIIKDLSELQVGAPIVHIDHGVGRYLGLQTLQVSEQLTEFLCLEYADGDKLYVPVALLHLINRYSGADPDQAPLHKLGTEQWQRAKHKAAEQVRDVAAELLDIYAKRAAQTRDASKVPDEQYAIFADGFPFEETPDQAKTIENVIADLQSDKPMDRLVCGDVGFGKTEVAMRAAFVAVQSGKQVAVLVPTTLLAQQHYQTFQDRFADWPFQIAGMSRFQSTKEQSKTLANLANGKVDIVIGTHKLLQEDVKFKSLGLLIIDEEHRFGVRQKEKLKSLRHNIDILALTATPIPRTLNMAFSGIRDLSLIATPPAKRLSIKTFIQEYRDSVIQEAITREIMRGGQVYFLHNEVSTIEKMARNLETLVTEARVSFAHGQMRERELEQVMSDFYHRRFNVLVCSTIIESGIDIPSANTIIINRADKFGIAQLHQLRGRVGRSHHQAYAYLLTPPQKLLSADAEKRLDAVASLEDLGIGFTLATHDLEIRGAGELLGEGQSGNMQAVGFSLYMELLSRAVEALKSGKPFELENAVKHGAEIDLQVPALIPDSYLPDVHLRLQCYKRIAATKTLQDLDDIQVEMIDRFGLLPAPTKNLFAITALKQKAEYLGILKIDATSKSGKIEFSDKPNINPMKIITKIQKQSHAFRLDGPTRLRFNLETHFRADRIQLIENLLNDLAD